MQLRTMLAALALTAGGPAFAQFGIDLGPIGPIDLRPSVEQCQDPDFLTDANQIVHNLCADVLGERLATSARQASREGRLNWTRVSRVALGAGRELNTLWSRTIRRAGPIDLNPVVPLNFLLWERDGRALSSCDEYVYQRFHTWHGYTRMLATARTDRAAFDQTFAEDGPGNIGHRYLSISPSSGLALHRMPGGGANSNDQAWDPLPLLPSERLPDLGVDVIDLPKNDFFALSREERAMVGRRSAALANKIDAGLNYWRIRVRGPSSAHLANRFPDAWQWHQNMNEALDHVPDVQLKVLAGRRANFRTLLTQRRSLRKTLSANHYRVRAVDNAIMVALLRADDDGCLDFGGAGEADRCDWAPGDLALAAKRALEPRVAFARARCEALAAAPEDVENGYSYRSAVGRRHYSTRPYGNEYNMELYLRRMVIQQEYYLSQFDLDGRNGGQPNIPAYRRAYGDDWAWGDRDWAHAAAGYHARWGLADGDEIANVCEFNPQLSAGAYAITHVFGDRSTLFDAEAGFDLRRERRVLDLEIFGNEYLTYSWENVGRDEPRDAMNFDFSRTGTPQFRRGVELCKTIPVAYIPFTVCAELAGTVGVNYDVELRGHEQNADGCSAELTAAAKVRPWAAVDALGTAGPGVAGLSGGLYVEVDLIDVGLPVDASAEAVSLDGRNVEIDVQADVQLELSSLSGSVGGYVQFPRVCVPFSDWCTGGRYSASFFEWGKAIDKTWTLLDQEWTVDLQVWNAICDVVDCTESR